jgi:hypothetical protein
MSNTKIKEKRTRNDRDPQKREGGRERPAGGRAKGFGGAEPEEQRSSNPQG